VGKLTPDEEKHLEGQTRLAAIVIAATGVLWVAGNWLGGQMGWAAKYAFLFDFAALAAFVWAMVVTWRVWRKRQGN
jgi:hypothetical protein